VPALTQYDSMLKGTMQYYHLTALVLVLSLEFDIVPSIRRGKGIRLIWPHD
jgi:hypothetical protein